MDAPAETGIETTKGAGKPAARRWAFALVAWSLFVWATRIDNIVGDESLDTADQAWRLALALSFVVLAVVAGWRWRRRNGPRGRPVVIVALAWWTIGVWIVRGGGIVFGDHDVAFIVVHLILAVISIALAALVLRSLSAPPPS